MIPNSWKITIQHYGKDGKPLGGHTQVVTDAEREFALLNVFHYTVDRMVTEIDRIERAASLQTGVDHD